MPLEGVLSHINFNAMLKHCKADFNIVVCQHSFVFHESFISNVFNN